MAETSTLAGSDHSFASNDYCHVAETPGTWAFDLGNQGQSSQRRTNQSHPLGCGPGCSDSGDDNSRSLRGCSQFGPLAEFQDFPATADFGSSIELVLATVLYPRLLEGANRLAGNVRATSGAWP